MFERADVVRKRSWRRREDVVQTDGRQCIVPEPDRAVAKVTVVQNKIPATQVDLTIVKTATNVGEPIDMQCLSVKPLTFNLVLIVREQLPNA